MTETQALLDCSKCGQRKPWDQFPPSKRMLRGRSSLCGKCHVAATRAWQRSNGEKIKAWRKSNYARRKAAGLLPPRIHDPLLARERGRYRRYAVTAEAYASMLAQQEGRCAICRRSAGEFARPLAIDHNRACCATTPTCGKCNRGLLCGPCNMALHSAESDSEWFTRAAAYLGRFR